MRVLTDKKRSEIVAAAGAAFVDKGFGGTTIADIAEAAGSSKATLYRYFEAKEEMFAAVVQQAGENFAASGTTAFLIADTLQASLHGLGHEYLSLLLSDKIMTVNRLVIAEAHRFPQLTRIYFENGPKKVLAYLETALRSMAAAGWLRLDDPAHASWIFKSLMELEIYERALWGFRVTMTESELDRHVRRAVRDFEAIHAL